MRIGIDKGTGGCLAPIFNDGSFLYMPIPEKKPTREKRTYAQIVGQVSSLLLENMPKRLRSRVLHYDPEFDTFTYGDPTPNKRRQLLRLKAGDLLVFYAGLEPEFRFDVSRLFIIGYFVVKHVYDFSRLPKADYKSLSHALSRNAHLKRKKGDNRLVIVTGDKSRSRLLSRALPLGNAGNEVLDSLQGIIGYAGSVLRAIGHWAYEENAARLKQYLKKGIAMFVQNDTRLFSYVLASDTGFAPNITGGYCTLACCKPITRRKAKTGDWVLGTLPKRLGANRLGYVMRVDETLTLNEYYGDHRFQMKKPDCDPNGDNIYYILDGKYRQLKNRHHSIKELIHDTKTDKVLISSLFWYFGEHAPEISADFMSVVKKGPNHKKTENVDLIYSFVSWLTTEYRVGIHSRSRDVKGGGHKVESKACYR